MKSILSKSALAELLDLEAWYDAQTRGLCRDVRQDFLAFSARIGSHPQLYQVVPVCPRGREIRYGNTDRFPTLVVYEVLATHLGILVVVHAKTHPSRWRRRLSNP